MNNQQEIELKLRLVQSEDYDNIFNLPAGTQWVSAEGLKVSHYETTYYDTPDRRLNRNQLAYRIRKSGDGFIITVKGSGKNDGGLHIRDEWNREVMECHPTVEPFKDLDIGLRLKEIVGDELLLPLFKTTFKRTSMICNAPSGSQIELSADYGEIVHDTLSEPLCEIELELKHGELADLLELGTYLSRQIPVVMDGRSKYSRGLLLSGIEQAFPKPTRPLHTVHWHEPIMSEVKRLIGEGLLDVFRRLEDFQLNPQDTESVHELRIKIRQLRAWISFIRPLLAKEEGVTLQMDLKTLAKMFAKVRELDTLIAKWTLLADYHQDLLQESNHLKAYLTAERKTEQDQLVWELQHGKATPNLLNLWAWTERESLQQSNPLFVKDYSVKRIKKWIEETNVQLDKVRLVNPDASGWETIHSLRIRIKKLRYVLGDLSSLNKNIFRQRLRKLKRLQDKLGELCDAQRHKELILSIRQQNQDHPLLSYECGIFLGLLIKCTPCDLFKGKKKFKIKKI